MADEHNQILAARLTELVEQAKRQAKDDGTTLSEARIARGIKISERAFNNYRKGRVPKDLRILDRIADHFGVKSGWLLGLGDAGVYDPLTPESKNGNTEDREDFMEKDVLRSLLLLKDELTELRRDVQDIGRRLMALEGALPQKGRKTRKW